MEVEAPASGPVGLYRIVLGGSEAAYTGALEPYDRIVSSLDFRK